MEEGQSTTQAVDDKNAAQQSKPDDEADNMNNNKNETRCDDDDEQSKEEAGAGDLREVERKALEELREGMKVLKQEVLVLWGVDLEGGDKGTVDVVLLKFLRARDWEVKEALDMLRDTLQWRKDNNMESLVDEEFDKDFSTTAFMDGKDREGNLVCYNVFGVLAAEEMYNKTLGSEEMRNTFLRWRVQLMEKGINQMDGTHSTMVQVNDLNHAPGPARKEVRLAIKQALPLFQDNYPEFAAKNIFINVPFWYYAFATIFSPFLTQRTKSKFVYARPSRVTDTLLKYISVEQIPVQYGGLKRDNDSDFSIEDEASEVSMKAGSTESIKIPAPHVGTWLIWELTVIGWDVSYKEEFIPEDNKSYTVIVQRERKIMMQDDEGQTQPLRNSFTNREPGNLMLVVHNSSFKKKRLLYRYKITTPAPA